VADGDIYSYLGGLSSHPNRPGDVSNFNPLFATRLAAAIQQAHAQGLPIGIESGFREPGQTGSAYDAGGNSSHTYGLASDVNGLDGPNGKITQRWAQIAEANGLHNPYGVGNTAEYNHWQLPATPLEQQPQLLASLKAAKATGNMQNVWSAYNSGSSAVAAGSPTTAGTTINSTPLDLVANVETGNRNIPQAIVDANTARGTPAGGYFQIIDPTWQRYAPAAGVDVKQYPFAMMAPRDVQAKVAGVIPVNQWGPNTVAALKAQYPGINTSQTLGSIQSQPSALAVAQNAPVSTTPGTASAGASGSPLSQAATTVAGAGGAGGAPNEFMQGAGNLEKAMTGGSVDGVGGQGNQIQPSPMIPGQPPHIPNPQMAAQTFGQTLNSMRTPPQWGPNPPGQPIYATAGPQGGGMAAPPWYGGSLPGVAAQQLQQLQMLSMMGGMGTTMGSPYGGMGYG
jgi:hypothetical protein